MALNDRDRQDIWVMLTVGRSLEETAHYVGCTARTLVNAARVCYDAAAVGAALPTVGKNPSPESNLR